MSEQKHKFELPPKVERYLAALSKLYGQEGERQLQQIIVNAQTRVHEAWSRDNWNGGTYGHALYLVVPDTIYLAVARRKDEIEERVRADLEKVHNVPNEFIEKVFLEMEVADADDWRRQSGALLQGNRLVADAAVKRIWVDGKFRLFLSHKSEVKRQVGELKEKLSRYGVSCFVAHADIRPTQEWQDEIENALATMDGFVALLTGEFHDSDWTDQEVGYALARGVPIIAARLERDPYGFIAKFQGLACTWTTAPEEIAKLLISHAAMFSAYVSALNECGNFDEGNVLAALLPSIEKLSDEQIDVLVEAYNTNFEVRGSFGFNGGKPAYYGQGLLKHLGRWTNRFYVADDEGRLHWF